jgi:phosphotriesterase-related protein
MHEHLFVEFGGAGAASLRPGPERDAIVNTCAAHVDRLRDFGVRTLVDPTTVDLGRNILLLEEVARKTKLQIVAATGLYGTAAYIEMRDRIGKGPEPLAEHYIKEITSDIEGTSVKAGIIKVTTRYTRITDHEEVLLLAAALASNATGVPITTHTENGMLGDAQQQLLTAAGVPAERIVIGHSCGSTDFDYHARIGRAGSYLGFDRFGMESVVTDETRAAGMAKLIEAGLVERLLVSHDSVWYWGGSGPGAAQNWHPVNFFERVVPMLKAHGVTDVQVGTILERNPLRVFQ